MARLQAFHLRLEHRLCPGLHLGQLGRAGVRHQGGVHKDALVLVAWTVRRCCEATLYIICCHLSSPATAWQGHSVFQCNPNASQCLSRLSRPLAACCGHVGMACPSQHPDGRLAQRGPDLWDIATAHLGAVCSTRHIAHPRGLVFNVPMSAHERQEWPGCHPRGP
jgi:hypothetical protein